MEEKYLKKMGIVIIFVGLAMLIFTFYQAFTYLNSPYPAMKIPESPPTSQSGQPDINKALAQAFSPFFDSILPLVFSSSYLFIMGLMGFWIMGRGIQLLKSQG